MTELDREFPTEGGEPARPMPFFPGPPGAGPTSGPPSSGGVPMAAPAPLPPQAPPSPQAPPAIPTATSAAVVKGRITIEDQVIEKIATLAALEVEGVTASSARAADPAQGAQHGQIGQTDNEVSVDVQLAVAYGCVVMDVAKDVKRNVARMVSLMLGLRVVAVHITVEDVSTPARDGQALERA